MPSVVFDVSKFRTRYPEFENVSDAQLQAMFDDAAALYLNNTETSIVTNLATRESLFMMLVAHMAQLGFGSKTAPASPLAGRVTSVSEGSVSISGDAPALPGTAVWFGLTKYGIAYWQATAPWRTMQYRAGRSWPQERTRDGAWL